MSKKYSLYQYLGIKIRVFDKGWSMGTSARERRQIIKKDRARTIILFERDYRNQKTVSLSISFLYNKPEITFKKAASGWSEYLSKRKTKIKDLSFHYDQRVLDSLVGQSQLQSLHVRNLPAAANLSPLALLPNLTELEIDGLSKGASLGALSQLSSLRKLKLSFRHADLDLGWIADLTDLKSLELGELSPGFMGKIILPNLDFLKPLQKLEELRLYAIVPEGKNYSVLAGLPNLQKVSYQWVRGQTPSVEELGAASEGLRKVAELKMQSEKERRDPKYNQWVRVK